MGYQPDEFEDTWADLVPEQPQQPNRLPYILAGLGIVLVILCLLLAAILFFGRDFLPGLGSTPVIIEPPPDESATATNISPTDVIGGITTDLPGTPTPDILPEASPTLAPTVTLPPDSETIVPPEAETTVPSDQVIAFQVASPPTIDGLANDWAALPQYESSHIVFSDVSWDGTDDLVAIWRLTWDDSNLYILAEVTDDIHVQTQSGNQLFRGDSLDMQFDTNIEADFGDGLSPDDFQITFSPGDFNSIPPSAWRFQGTASGQILDAPGGNHETVQATQTAGGYVLEAAIPWSDLSLTPSLGLSIGLSLNANDNDTPATAVQEIMKSHVATRTLTDPTTWGKLTLQ